MKLDLNFLRGKGLYDNDLDILIKAIQQSTVLDDLNLYNNKLTLADGKLIDAIANNKTLKWLSL